MSIEQEENDILAAESADPNWEPNTTEHECGCSCGCKRMFCEPTGTSGFCKPCRLYGCEDGEE